VILYDANNPGEMDCRGFGLPDILRVCVEIGGRAQGEHGRPASENAWNLMGETVSEIDLKAPRG